MRGSSDPDPRVDWRPDIIAVDAVLPVSRTGKRGFAKC